MKTRIGRIFLILLLLPGPANAQGKPEKEKIRWVMQPESLRIPYPTLQRRQGSSVTRVCRWKSYKRPAQWHRWP